MKQRVTAWMVMVVMGVALAGCGGGGAEVRSEVTSVTTGRQLMDLKQALDTGAMTQDEYERERVKILDKD